MGNDNIAPGSVELQNWQNKVIQSLDGVTGTRDPNTVGPTFDPNLFNQPGDNTMIFIMTPKEFNVGRAVWERKYPQKTAMIVSTIKNMPGMAGAGVSYKDYERLHYRRNPTTGVYEG